MEVAERAEPGTVILCMLPDTGERYMTTPLFEAITEEMTDEEVALSQSTPGYQLGEPKGRCLRYVPCNALDACCICERPAINARRVEERYQRPGDAGGEADTRYGDKHIMR